jgi:hypothetical protein
MNDSPVAVGSIGEDSVPAKRRSLMGSIAWASLIAGVLDIGYVIVFYGLKGVSATRILQGVAAGLIGLDAAMNGGIATAGLGLTIHFAIAFVVAAVFVVLSRIVGWLVNYPFVSGPLYGIGVWLVMNLAILPLTAVAPRSFPPPNWIPVFVAHVLCVGLPIALVVRWRERI